MVHRPPGAIGSMLICGLALLLSFVAASTTFAQEAEQDSLGAEETVKPVEAAAHEATATAVMTSPGLISLQGTVTDVAGNPVNVTRNIRVRLFEGLTGPPVWSETQSVTITDGLFEMVLGTTTPLTVPFDVPYYFGVKIGSDPQGPRTLLTEVPYAFTARALHGKPVSSTVPTNGQFLSWNGSAWAPTSVSAGPVWSRAGTTAYYNAGKVGIGTAAVDALTEIYHNSSLSNPHLLLHENGNDYARINLKNNNGSNYWTIAAYVASNPRNDRLNFWNGVNGDLMTITGDGEVGIGVNISPKVPFHVGEDRRVLFGRDTLGTGAKMMWLPDRSAFRVGTVASGTPSVYWNRDSLGTYSFASGVNTRARGTAATAMGADTEARGSYSFASGFFSNAFAQYSTAMGFNTDASGIGSTALGYSTDAERNYSTALGYFAEAQGIHSTAIGNFVRAQSYSSVAVGRYNVGGGSATTWSSGDPIFEVGIGTGPSNRANAMTVRKNGNVGIGTTAPGARLHVSGGELRIGTLEELSDGGSYVLESNSTLRPVEDNMRSLGTSSQRWTSVWASDGTINTSDRRLKQNIAALPSALDQVLRLEPVSFQWRSGGAGTTNYGLVAQDVMNVIPEAVADTELIVDEETGQMTEVEAEYMGINYSRLIPFLIKAIQEQEETIAALQARVEDLEGQ